MTLESLEGVRFTKRELDIISCLLNGRTPKSISALLDVSPRTVETHLRNIMQKVDCNTKEQLVEFIEKSQAYLAIKKHYHQLRVDLEFKKYLQKIRPQFNKANFVAKVLYQRDGEGMELLINQLSAQLNEVGLKIEVLEFNELGKAMPLKCRETGKIAHLCVYAIPKGLWQQLQTPTAIQKLLFESFPNVRGGPSGPILFLITDKELVWSTLPSFSGADYLEITRYEDFRFVIIEILKTLFPDVDIERTVVAFKQIYERFGLPLSEQSVVTKSLKGLTEATTQRCKAARLSPKVLRRAIGSVVAGALLAFIFAKKGEFTTHKPFHGAAKVTFSQHTLTTNEQGMKGLLNSLSSWNGPFPNPYFTGRRDKLREIALKFKEIEKEGTPVAIVVCAGLGGIGKTEIAKWYMNTWKEYREKNYSFRLWFDAEKFDDLLEAYNNLGQHLGITTPDTPAIKVIEVIKQWLERNPGWLIIYDNAENYDALLNYFPRSGGHILVTSRQMRWPNVVYIDPMTEKEGTALLLKIINRAETSPKLKALVKKLEGIPLAISHTGAYILHRGKTIEDYLQEYEQEHEKLLEDRNQLPGLILSPPSVTWNVTLNKIQKESELAYKLINYFAFLCPDKIPRTHLAQLFPEYQHRPDFPRLIDQAVEVCLNHALIKFNPQDNTLSLHRLVQEVMGVRQKKERTYQEWLGRVLGAIIDDKDAYFILGGLAVCKEAIPSIINHYESTPASKKTALFYQSLGCCYLVLDDFAKAEVCFHKSIQKEANSSIYFEYAQALYLRERYPEAIQQLKLSLSKKKDNQVSYFSELEKSSVLGILQKEIERVGLVKCPASHLSHYLLLKVFLELNNEEEFKAYFPSFQQLAKEQNNPLLNTLYQDLLSMKSSFSKKSHLHGRKRDKNQE